MTQPIRKNRCPTLFNSTMQISEFCYWHILFTKLDLQIQHSNQVTTLRGSIGGRRESFTRRKLKKRFQQKNENKI